VRPVMAVIPLSVLHFGVRAPEVSAAAQLRAMVAAAPEIEDMGYKRLWLAEHHEPAVTFACPEILIPAIASATRTIRVGSAGVLLNFYSPLKIAESFRALEALYPGRIDLGISAGLTAHEETRQALAPGFDMQQARETRLYARKADELVAYCRNLLPREHRFANGPVPEGEPSPPLYFLGTGGGIGNMKLAARWGTPFCYSLAHGDPVPGKLIVRQYRAAFQSAAKSRPYAILAGNVICTPTDREAVQMIEKIREWLPDVRVNVFGSASRCVRKIAALVEEYDCDEFVVIPIYTSVAGMLPGLELLAAANNAMSESSTESRDMSQEMAR
jgi:luciferase family oxidoreductase group 1